MRSDGLHNILVMCDCYTPQGQPLPSNHRAKAMEAFSGKEDEEIWFGLEQEFTLFNLDERTPLGWPVGGMPNRAQGPYYCSVGPQNVSGSVSAVDVDATDVHETLTLVAVLP